jgi:hypothetical protein
VSAKTKEQTDLLTGAQERWKPNMTVLRAVIQCVKATESFTEWQ